MRIAILASTLALPACATASHPPSVDLTRSLDAMVGQPVGVAVARLGEPIASVPMGSETVHGWGYGFTRTEFTNAAPGWVDAANSKGGVFPAPRRTAPDSCVIRLVAGPDGLIRTWDFQGDDRRCHAYAGRVLVHAVARTD